MWRIGILIIVVLCGMPFALIGWVAGFIGFAVVRGWKSGYKCIENL